MISALDYLEAAKTEEIASQLVSEGYTVKREEMGLNGTLPYDLVAERGNDRIVFEVKAQARLQQESAHIRQLRKKAHEQGYSEFRLVIVNPPYTIAVEIEGFHAQLLEHLRENMPEELKSLSSKTSIKGLSDLEFDSVTMRSEGIRIRGAGVVNVELEYGGAQEREGLNVREGFPFTFDILLNQNRSIDTILRLQVETSSFYEETLRGC